MIIQALAFLAQFLFISATAAQTLKCVRDGHADGLSHGLIWQLLGAMTVMVFYTIFKLDSDLVLLSGYSIQIVLFLIIAKYKYLPR